MRQMNLMVIPTDLVCCYTAERFRFRVRGRVRVTVKVRVRVMVKVRVRLVFCCTALGLLEGFRVT